MRLRKLITIAFQIFWYWAKIFQDPRFWGIILLEEWWVLAVYNIEISLHHPQVLPLILTFHVFQCVSVCLYSLLSFHYHHVSINVAGGKKVHSCLSSCFLQNIDFDDILATVSFLMEKNVQAKFWTTYQERRYLNSY